jgi:membrane-bound lytic murein transglycosylase B
MCRELHWEPEHVYGSHKGAIGPFQFIPETWIRNAVDANGDGRKDPFDIEDAAYSAANYLVRRGGLVNLRKALWHYNQDKRYVKNVMRYLRYS